MAYYETPTEGTALIILKKFKKTGPSPLEEEIARLLEQLSATPPEGEEYDKVAEQLVKLYKLKEVDSKSRVSPDALLGAAVTLATALLVIGYEQTHVIGTKAFGFIGKKL